MHNFTRTTCGCPDDVANCRKQPGSIEPEDLPRIAAHLGEPLTEVLRFFKASPGAVLLDRTTGQHVRIGSITPRQQEDGTCVFLENDRCRVHAVAPFGCAYFDVHMDTREADRRSFWLIRQQVEPEFQVLRALVGV